ncbi:unnamed protein product [Calypogeia fissa]
MSNQFALQVTPELMQRLVDQGEKKPKRRRQAKEKPRPFSSLSSLPQEKIVEWHEPDAQQAPSAGGWPARDTLFPPFGGIFGAPLSVDPHAADLKKELAPVYQAIEESKQLGQRLQKQGDNELAKVQEMARDLQDKQYRAPSHAPPCSNERGKCIECYNGNQQNPLLCSKFVQAFVTCSRRAQEAFAASVSS